MIVQTMTAVSCAYDILEVIGSADSRLDDHI